jgi:hypothetical protein
MDYQSFKVQTTPGNGLAGAKDGGFLINDIILSTSAGKPMHVYTSTLILNPNPCGWGRI